MENRSHALIAGLFTLLLGIATLLALWWFGGKHEVTRDYLVVTNKNISGLSEQAQVRYRGIRVGKVERISFDREDFSQTLIHIRIRDDIPITAGTVAQLGLQGVTGIAHVLLEDNGETPERLDDTPEGLPRIPMGNSTLEDVADVGRETLLKVRDAVEGINQLLSPKNQQSISNTLAHLEKITGQAQAATTQLSLFLSPENSRLLHSSLQGVEKTVGEIGPFLSDARGLVHRWQQVGDKLERTLGDPSTNGIATLTPRINELGSELSSASRQLNRVLQMLEESPQSLIFGPQRNQPGPGEAGFLAPNDPRRLP